MGVSVLIIGFLVSTASLNVNSTKALVEEKQNQYKMDSFDGFTWKWSLTEVVSTESTNESFIPSLAVDSLGNIHIAWYDWTSYSGSGTDHDIFYKKYDDSTSSWTTTEVVSTESTGVSNLPSLAVDHLGNVHIAWNDNTSYVGAGVDNDIFYKRWDTSSSSWSTTEVVSTESFHSSMWPTVAVDYLGNVHVAWDDLSDIAGSGVDKDIFYKFWNSSSSTWSITEVISTESSGHSEYPFLVTDTLGNVHVAWVDHSDYALSGSDADIFYKYWNATTSTWNFTLVVSEESTGDGYKRPSLAVDKSMNVHIAWVDETDYLGAGDDKDIFYKYKDSYTTHWSTAEVVSTVSTEFSNTPSLAIDSIDNIHIAWYDATNYAGSGTDWDIFYQRLDSSSSTWTTTEVVSTECINGSYYASLAIDILDNVHISWYGVTDYAGAGTDRDILYKKFGGPPMSPELADIIPNPTESSTIFLDWNNIIGATTYLVYQSPSYIWSVEELTPIDIVSSSEYIDSGLSEGFYFYAIVASNFAGNSPISNCHYVEVKLAELEAPTLALILPNPTNTNKVSLEWSSINEAIEYHIYRSDSYILSVDSLTPTYIVSEILYLDTLPEEGSYFYVIVAANGSRNSNPSNCQHVEYIIPITEETNLNFIFVLSSLFLIMTILRTRKKLNQN